MAFTGYGLQDCPRTCARMGTVVNEAVQDNAQTILIEAADTHAILLIDTHGSALSAAARGVLTQR